MIVSRFFEAAVLPVVVYLCDPYFIEDLFDPKGPALQEHSANSCKLIGWESTELKVLYKHRSVRLLVPQIRHPELANIF